MTNFSNDSSVNNDYEIITSNPVQTSVNSKDMSKDDTTASFTPPTPGLDLETSFAVLNQSCNAYKGTKEEHDFLAECINVLKGQKKDSSIPLENALSTTSRVSGEYRGTRQEHEAISNALSLVANSLSVPFTPPTSPTPDLDLETSFAVLSQSCNAYKGTKEEHDLLAECISILKGQKKDSNIPLANALSIISRVSGEYHGTQQEHEAISNALSLVASSLSPEEES